MELYIWKPVEFDVNWKTVNTEKFDNIYPSWERRRIELQKNNEQYQNFIDQIKRKQAIDTGIIERMYDLKQGITETFIKEGFVDSYLQHGDTNIPPNLLMSFLKDNFDAIDFIFDFVKSNRNLSVSFIKELHQLITSHQDETEAVDQFGNRHHIKLLKGEFKKLPNNPLRDGIRFIYCPPEQVASEMDQLISIYNSLSNCHVLIKAAFLHHSFVQIHPFQDGNGRMARLLASFVLIKEGLFPLSIDRMERKQYIESLEEADKKVYQPLIDLFSNNQISSIEKSLNFKTADSTSGYENIIDLLNSKILTYKENEEENRRIVINNNMNNIFDIICKTISDYKTDIMSKLSNIIIDTDYCRSSDHNSHYFARQIINYAKTYDYYVNLSLDKCWARMFFKIDEKNVYRMIISLHHYGYDNSTFAIGAFLSKGIPENENSDKQKKGREYIDVSLGLPPLTFSSEKDSSLLRSSIIQQIQLSIMATLSYITNEIS